MSSASKSVVRKGSESSQNVSDISYRISATLQHGFGSSTDPPAFIQVMNKLKKTGMFKDSQVNELRTKAEEISTKEGLEITFSHLMEDSLEDARREAEKEVTLSINSNNPLEHEMAKNREAMLYSKVADFKVTISLSKVDVEYGRDMLCGAARFFKDEFYFGANHANITIGNIVLEWGRESLVIPRHCSETSPFAIFSGTVNIQESEYAIKAANTRPKTNEPLKTLSEQYNLFFESAAQKKAIFTNLIELIMKYNTRYYYNIICRNCQSFVKDVLHTLGLEAPKFTKRLEDYLKQLKAEKTIVPDSFRTHGDVDAYVMNLQSKGELDRLPMADLEYLFNCAYLTHHNGQPCDIQGCKAKVIEGLLQARQK